MYILFRDTDNSAVVGDYVVSQIIRPGIGYDAQSLLGSVVDFTQFFRYGLRHYLSFGSESERINSGRLATAYLFSYVIDGRYVSSGLISCIACHGSVVAQSQIGPGEDQFTTVSIDFLVNLMGQTDKKSKDMPSIVTLANLFRAAMYTSGILLERGINE